LRCFFCSNEGLPLSHKNIKHIDTRHLKYLIKLLYSAGLRNISLTRVDPTLHPDLLEIINFINKYKFRSSFFHTNGVGLNKKIIKHLIKGFTKIAVSVYSTHYETWSKMTGGTKIQFKKLISNLNILSTFVKKINVELKLVPIKGYNTSKKEFIDFLEMCDKFGFKFKILNFEPITEEQKNLVVPYRKIKKILIDVGCKERPKKKKFRGQSNYLPINNFSYKKTKGVAIKIGCGDRKICRECFASNEIFISPELKIKPCHMNNYQIDILDFIKTKKNDKVLNMILKSRLFLASMPGAGAKVWQEKRDRCIIKIYDYK